MNLGQQGAWGSEKQGAAGLAGAGALLGLDWWPGEALLKSVWIYHSLLLWMQRPSAHEGEPGNHGTARGGRQSMEFGGPQACNDRQGCKGGYIVYVSPGICEDPQAQAMLEKRH